MTPTCSPGRSGKGVFGLSKPSSYSASMSRMVCIIPGLLKGDPLSGPPARLHLAHGPPVLGQLRVAGQEGDALAEGLGQQQAVEWIFVQGREAIDAHRVLAGDGKLDIAIVEQPPAQQARLDPEVLPSQGALDGDLPQAGRAEAKLPARVRPEPTRPPGKP